MISEKLLRDGRYTAAPIDQPIKGWCSKTGIFDGSIEWSFRFRMQSPEPEIDCREVFGRYEPCPVKGMTWDDFARWSKSDWSKPSMGIDWSSLEPDYTAFAFGTWRNGIPVIENPYHYVIMPNVL